MPLTPTNYFKVAEISLPISTWGRLKAKTADVELAIGQYLKRQARTELQDLPDYREYRIEFGPILRLPSTTDNHILFKLPIFTYLWQPEEAEIGEVLHPAVFGKMPDTLTMDEAIELASGKKFIVVLDKELYKIMTPASKADAIKYMLRSE